MAAAFGFFGDGEGFGGFHGVGGIGDEQDDFSFGVGADDERRNGLGAGTFRNQPQLENAVAGGRGNFLAGEDDAKF